MRGLAQALALALVLAPAPTAIAAPQGEAPTLAAAIKRVKPSIVGVGTFLAIRRPPAALRGTGFVVADGRHIITNLHVLPDEIDGRNKEVLAVFTGAGQSLDVRAVEKVAEDPAHDVAVLRLLEGPPLPALSLGDDALAEEGDLVAFTGFPIGTVLGFHPVTHRGIVSARTPVAIPQVDPRRLDTRMLRRLRARFDVLQLDATAYPGNSGSPLYIPATGEVVGIVSSVFVKETKENVLKDPSGITYAVPIRHARRLLAEIGVAAP